MTIVNDRQSQDQLTKREKEIVNLIAREYTTIEIASELILSFETIKSQRKRIMDKLRVSNVAGIVREAFIRKLLFSQS